MIAGSTFRVLKGNTNVVVSPPGHMAFVPDSTQNQVKVIRNDKCFPEFEAGPTDRDIPNDAIDDHSIADH